MSGQPFTCAEALSKPSSGPQFVQVLIGKVPTCARIREGWIAQDGTFLWSVALLSPVYGKGSFPERLVRQCSGVDGRCACAAEKAADRASFSSHESADFERGVTPNFCQAGVVAPPDSLMCEKTSSEGA